MSEGDKFYRKKERGKRVGCLGGKVVPALRAILPEGPWGKSYSSLCVLWVLPTAPMDWSGCLSVLTARRQFEATSLLSHAELPSPLNSPQPPQLIQMHFCPIRISNSRPGGKTNSTVLSSFATTPEPSLIPWLASEAGASQGLFLVPQNSASFPGCISVPALLISFPPEWLLPEISCWQWWQQ